VLECEKNRSSFLSIKKMDKKRKIGMLLILVGCFIPLFLYLVYSVIGDQKIFTDFYYHSSDDLGYEKILKGTPPHRPTLEDFTDVPTAIATPTPQEFTGNYVSKDAIPRVYRVYRLFQWSIPFSVLLIFTGILILVLSIPSSKK
jgi:hypothetical protein